MSGAQEYRRVELRSLLIGPALSLCLLLAKERTQALNVAREYRERHVALESNDPMVAAQLQTMHFQRIDGGLHGAVLLAQPYEFGVALRGPIGGAEPALLGHHHQLDNLLERGLVVRAVEPLVHADAAQRV